MIMKRSMTEILMGQFTSVTTKISLKPRIEIEHHENPLRKLLFRCVKSLSSFLF